MRGCYAKCRGRKNVIRKPKWLDCVPLLPNGRQGWLSIKHYHVRHCGLKGITCLRRKGMLIIYHTDRQRRQQGQSRGLGTSEPLGRNPSFCQGEVIFHRLYLSLSEIITNRLNSRNIPQWVRTGYLLHTYPLSLYTDISGTDVQALIKDINSMCGKQLVE